VGFAISGVEPLAFIIRKLATLFRWTKKGHWFLCLYHQKIFLEKS